MCLAVPARVTEIGEDQMATVDVAGVTRKVALDLVPDTKVDDYVIVHVGFAIQRLDEQEARRTLALLDQIVSDSDHSACDDPPPQDHSTS